jgi:hypothetical protein
MSINPYDSPETAPRKMSGSAKALIGLGIGCGIFVLLCCGIFGGGGFWFVKTVQESVSKDPAKIRELTERIVAISIPENLPPAMCLDFVIPLANTRIMSWAQYGDLKDHNMLGLVQFGEQFDENQMRMQWRTSMRQNGSRGYDDIEVEQSERHEQQVNGEPATFTVARGRDHDDREVWQVTGAFHGKGGPAMLFLKVSQSEFSKDQVLEILESMKSAAAAEAQEAESAR